MVDFIIKISRLLLLTSILCSVTLNPHKVFAENTLPGTAQTMDPRSLGTAGAMIAVPGGINGIYLNPASIAMVPLFHLEGMYQFTSRENMHMGGLAIADSATKPGIGAGVSFNYTGCNSNRTSHDSFDGRLNVAGFIGKVFAIGLTGRYLRVEQNRSDSTWGPAGKPSFPASGSRQIDGLTLDAGASLHLIKMLTISVVGYNLTNTESMFAPIMLGAGASIGLLKKILIDVDTLIDFTSHDKTKTLLRAGGEILFADMFVVRAGYQYDFYYERNLVAAGLGYVHSSFGVDAGFTQEIVEKGRTVFAIGFKFFIPSF